MNKNKTKKVKDFKGTMNRFLSYFKKYRLAYVIIFLLISICTILRVFTPKLLGNATSLVYENIKSGKSINFEILTNILVFLLVLNILSVIFQFLAYYISSIYSQKIIFDLRQQINIKLDKLYLKYYDKNKFGDILSRISNDVDNFSSMLGDGLIGIIEALVIISGIIYMMISISFIMTIIAILTLPISAYAAKFIINKSQKYFKQKQKLLGEVNAHTEETFSAIEVIKAYNKEEDSICEFNEINDKLSEKDIKSSFLSMIMMPIMAIISNIGYIFVSIVGAYLFIIGKIRLGDIQAFLSYTRQFGRPVSQMASVSTVMQSFAASAERIFELLDEEELDITYTKFIPKDLKGNIKFEDVKFGYTEKILMENINLEIKQGETVAVIGPTGAGKTTLVNLLMRFYDVNSGKITVDGINIKEFDRDEYRKNFGMVLQDTWLFNGSIYDNIAYSNEKATKEDVIRASKLANAHHFIMTQENRYETIINEEASNLSVGEKQLITIARAILANPKILILDEATSSVDTRTEIQIKDGLDKLSKGKTTFIIAHRLSTIKNADKVILMENGSIVKIGTYETVVGKE